MSEPQQQQQQHVARIRKSVAWEQQHVSSVKVAGRVRLVIPLSFRELHLVLDCSSNSSSASSSPSTQQQQQQQRNWVDLHVLDTWATRCGLLVEGDWVELQNFGVFRPSTSSSGNSTQPAAAAGGGADAAQYRNRSLSQDTTSTTSISGSAALNKKALIPATMDSSVQFWIMPESRGAPGKCPFVLAPVAQSTFVVERGQRLLLHDNTSPAHMMMLMSGSDNQNSQQQQQHQGSPVDVSNTTDANSTIRRSYQSELSLRGVGSRTPQQLFIQSMHQQQQQQFEGADPNLDNNSKTRKRDSTSTAQQQQQQQQQLSADQSDVKSSANSAGRPPQQPHAAAEPSLGSGVGKNLFANCFRFVDVMRGLNSHLVPLLKKIRRNCAGVQSILDAGCGSGLISFALKCADPAPEIVATDRSSAMSALVQEKNQTFAGLINKKLLHKAQQQHQQQQQGGYANSSTPQRSLLSAAASPASPAGGNNSSKNNNNSSDAPLVQFVIGDLSASPERFVILPSGTNPTEVAVGGRKQFDTLLCIDVLSFLPSMEAMKRALFNLVLHAKPYAKLLLSVPNLSACAEDAAKLTSASSLVNNTGGSGGAAAAASYADPEQRPKVQRSLHFEYDRHSLSLGCSVYLSHGGKLDVVERQWYDVLTTTSTVGNIKVKSTVGGAAGASAASVAAANGRRPGGGATANAENNNNDDDEDDKDEDDNDNNVDAKKTDLNGGAATANKSLTRDDGVRKVLRRHTEWFGFSCPNPSASANNNVGNNAASASTSGAGGGSASTGGGESTSPQIFYEQMEELVLHPTVLECMFQDMGWHVDEVWLFNALERGGACASPSMNTMAVLGAVPGSQSPGKNSTNAPGGGGSSSSSGSTSSDQPSLESAFSHRLYTLTRKG